MMVCVSVSEPAASTLFSEVGGGSEWRNREEQKRERRRIEMKDEEEEEEERSHEERGNERRCEERGEGQKEHINYLYAYSCG